MKKPRNIQLLCALILWNSLGAQNLIINGNFEDIKSRIYSETYFEYYFNNIYCFPTSDAEILITNKEKTMESNVSNKEMEFNVTNEWVRLLLCTYPIRNGYIEGRGIGWPNSMGIIPLIEKLKADSIYQIKFKSRMTGGDFLTLPYLSCRLEFSNICDEPFSSLQIKKVLFFGEINKRSFSPHEDYHLRYRNLYKADSTSITSSDSWITFETTYKAVGNEKYFYFNILPEDYNIKILNQRKVNRLWRNRKFEPNVYMEYDDITIEKK